MWTSTPLQKTIGLALAAVLLGVTPQMAAAQNQQPTSASSSSPRHQGIGIGVKGGPLFSSLSEANVSNAFSKRTGFVGGLFIGGNRPGVVGVGVDLLYARKGAKQAGTDEVANLDYLEVPVYMRVNIGSSSLNGVNVYATGGVDLNFLIRGKLNTGQDIKDQFERADYGIAVGAGVEITRFILEGRYTRGLGNIAKDKNAPVLKTQSFALMVGVRFN